MSNIVTRRIPFQFPADIEPYWQPEFPEFAAVLNGLSLTMPYLEPFLIRSIRDACERISDEDILAEAKGFIEQEAQHFSQHRKFNDLLKAKGYGVLAGIEQEMTESYAALSQKSLQHRMAYTSGFETMTLGLAKWFVNERRWLFGNSDSRVASVMMWHIVEETEHKNVAFNVYNAACPGYGAWAFGVFHGSFHVMYYAMRGAGAMLKQDGLWRRLRTRLSLLRLWGSFGATLIPVLLSALLPNHHPEKHRVPAWIACWIEEYGSCAGIPLLDTSDPDVPPRFV